MPCPIWKVGRPDARRPDHPLFAGRPGTIGTRAGNFCLQTADFLLVIGSRLNLRQISYNWARFAPAAVVVQVDIDPAELAKPFVRPALAVEADARDFLHTLAQQALAHTLPDFSDWARWCRALPSRYLNAPVLVIVLANNGYLSIRQTHENFFGSVVGGHASFRGRFPGLPPPALCLWSFRRPPCRVGRLAVTGPCPDPRRPVPDPDRRGPRSAL